MKLQTLLNSNFLVNSNREERLNKSSPEKNYPVDPKLEYLQRVYSHEKYTQAKEALTRSRNLKITCVYSKTQPPQEATPKNSTRSDASTTSKPPSPKTKTSSFYKEPAN